MVTSQMVDLKHTLQFHLPILEAIEERDARRAFSLMTDHLLDAQNLALHAREEERAKQFRAHLAGAGHSFSTRRR